MTNDNSNKQNLPEKDVVLKDVEISNDSVVSENASEKEDLIVEIKGLYKKYAKAADFVIHDINIECRSGEIVGLLGKNGAGKSTTIKCLTGFFPFDKGEIKICGHDIKTEPVKAKMNLGYVPDNRAMFDKMTGTEYINFIADLHKTPVEDRVARIDEMQKIFVESIDKVWDEKKHDIVLEGNVAKFTQNDKLKEYILKTQDKIIVEASPYDNI